MNISTKYNSRSPAVKRLMKEAMELHEACEDYFAQPLEDNLFEWHFTVRGADGTDFTGGVYHGKILLPPEYPMKPPSIILLTPNGRFEVGKKICLSMSAHHPETWQPSWSIRTLLLAIIGFMPSKGEGAIGAVDYTPHERKVLAARSLDWTCDQCGAKNRTTLPAVSHSNHGINKEAAMLASQITFKGEKENEATKANHNPSGSDDTRSITQNATDIKVDSTISEDLMDGDNVDSGEQIENVQAKNENDPKVNEVSTTVIENNDRSNNGTHGLRQRRVLNNEGRSSQNVRDTGNANTVYQSGICSFVLLWIVVIALVILILRRLCMDVVFIGKV